MATKPRKSFVSPHSTRHWTLVAGLAVIPVGMTKAYDDVGSGRVPGTEVCPEHEVKIARRDRICVHDGKEHLVNAPVKGYEYEKGRYAILTDEETRSLKLEHGEGRIELVACLDEDQLDSTLVEGTYLAFPLHDSALTGYAALLHFLESRKKMLVGVGAWYGSTRAFAITADAGVVVVSLCNYLSNLRSGELQTVQAIELPMLKKTEEAQANAFFGTLPDTMDWESVTDVAAERQHEAIAEKVKTGKVTAVEPVVVPDAPPDIFEAMRATISEKKKKPVAKKQASRKRTRV